MCTVGLCTAVFLARQQRKKTRTTIATTKLEIVVYKPKDHCILANGQRFSVLAVFSLFALVNYGPPSKYFFFVLLFYFCTGLHNRPVIKANKMLFFLSSYRTFSFRILCVFVYNGLLFCFSPWMVPAILPFSRFFAGFSLACNAQPWEK